PALHGPIREKRAAVQDPGADGDGARDAAHPHWGGRARRRAVPELPFEIPPPALHRAVREKRTGVVVPAAHGEGAGDSGHLHWGGGSRRPCGGVGDGPVAELPVDVPPPAPHRAVPKERTTVVAPGGDGDGVGEVPGPAHADHGDWHGGNVVEGPV